MGANWSIAKMGRSEAQSMDACISDSLVVHCGFTDSEAVSLSQGTGLGVLIGIITETSHWRM